MMNGTQEMVSLTKMLYAKIFFQLDDEQLQKVYDSTTPEEKEKLIELKKACA